MSKTKPQPKPQPKPQTYLVVSLTEVFITSVSS